MPIWGREKTIRPIVGLPREEKKPMSFNAITPVDATKVVSIKDVEHTFKRGHNFQKRDRIMQPLADELVTLPEGQAREFRSPNLLHPRAVSTLRNTLGDMGYSLCFRTSEKAQYAWAVKRTEQWYQDAKKRSEWQKHRRVTLR